MNTILADLKVFLEDAHKNGTDCAKAEAQLARATETLRYATVTNEEEQELLRIVTELEQIHTVCSIKTQNEDEDALDCGV
jgi:hypothetical protein